MPNHTIIWRPAEDSEFCVRLSFSFCPGEKQTWEYPGSPAMVEDVCAVELWTEARVGGKCKRTAIPGAHAFWNMVAEQDAEYLCEVSRECLAAYCEELAESEACAKESAAEARAEMAREL